MVNKVQNKGIDLFCQGKLDLASAGGCIAITYNLVPMCFAFFLLNVSSVLSDDNGDILASVHQQSPSNTGGDAPPRGLDFEMVLIC